MRLSKPVTLFSVLLVAPTTIFINALSTNGLISRQSTDTIASAIVYAGPRCTGTQGLSGKGIPITRDKCSELPTTVEMASYLSAKGVSLTIDTNKLQCKIIFYGSQLCSGLSIGETEVILAGNPGPCVTFFDILSQLPNGGVGANSATLTCEAKPV